jgi:hypothetical protein
MAIKVYKRIGIRRDRNLADVSDSTAALNNLLDTLVDDANSTFISEDLNAIRNVFSVGLTNEGYRQIVGSAEIYTDSNGVTQTFFPRITYQNRLNRFETFSGKPRINGGGGLTAKYYNKEQVYENTTDIFSGAPFKTDNFWEAGQFTYSGKITPEAVDVNGGVEWEGYFIPTSTGQHTFYVDGSTLLTFDFQTQGYVSGIGTYTEVARVGLSSIFSSSGSINTNTLTLASATNTKHIGIGQSVSASGIVAGTTIESYNRDSGVITLLPPSGTTYALSSNVSGNVTFFKTIGQSTQVYYTTYVLEAYQKYRIRFRYYIPQSVDAIAAQRNISFVILRPGGSTDEFLRYQYLYDLNYDFSNNAKGTLNSFLDNSIISSGGTLGGTASYNDYVKVQTSKKVDIRYQPKSSVSDVIKATTTGTTVNSSNVVTISNTSGIEVGNYVFGTGIPDNTTVNQIIINNSIILNNSATASGSVTLTFIDHRGLVKRAVGSGSAGTFTLSSGNTTDLKSGMVMIGSGVQAYTGVTTTGSASAFTISPSQTIGAGTTVYFYQSKGLINNALEPFCTPSTTTCLIVSSLTASGSSTISVNSTTGISNGWSVQGYQFDSGTTISSFTSSSITLNKPTIRSLIAGANFTVTNASGDRTLCCPPTDTSPPFNPTLDGLETVSASPSLKIHSGNIVFDALTVGTANTITAYNSSTDVSACRLSIQTASGTYKILCT